MQLAARIEEVHICPLANGPDPHVGGPVVSGSPDVQLGEMAAARVTDLVTCEGPPDQILQGSTSVFINELQAARLGDPTDHTGRIITGFATVIIGDEGMGDPCLTALAPVLDNSLDEDADEEEESESPPLQGSVEESVPADELQSETPTEGTPGSQTDSTPLAGQEQDNQWLATTSDSDTPNPLAGLPDGTLLAYDPNEGKPAFGGQPETPSSDSPQQPASPPAKRLATGISQDQVDLQAITDIYPLPPGPKPPKPLVGKISAAQQKKFDADQTKYLKAKAKFDDKIQPTKDRMQAIADLLNDKALTDKYNLQTPQRKAAFLGQLGAETSGLRNILEGESQYTGKDFVKYDNRKDLGNNTPGDGKMYRGRGPFQVTGRAAYTQAGKAVDIDLENHPELASDDPKIGAQLAAWYWKNKQTNLFDTSRKKLLVDPITKKSLIAGYTNKKKKTGIIFKKFSLSDLADRGDFFNVSHAVNPGLLNLKDRLSDSKKATKLLSPTLPPK